MVGITYWLLKSPTRWKAAAELETTAATMRLSDSMSKSTEVLAGLTFMGGGGVPGTLNSGVFGTRESDLQLDLTFQVKVKIFWANTPR